jgi:NYN domain
MAESVKSVLYVDYDSIHRSLKASGSLAADRLAQRVAGWVAAIESGRLVVPKGKAPTRRRMQARRCYADPVLLGKGRLALVACGFEIIDCPITAGHQRNSAGLQIVLDAMDWLARDGPYDEFVLLSADSDLAPALQRLRAQGKATVIYAPTDLGDEYRALSDGQVDEGLLLALLNDEVPVSAGEAEAPPPSSAEAQRARASAASTAPPAGERNEVEALARKVNAATSVPVFAPRTFADLFRFLAQEIAERGYHFQETADNVTARLGEAGRTATRRQVMFVVKGLALKGHVFSTTDTAERLAEVFREQVNYLIDHAGLDLSDRERELLPSWIAGRAGADRTAQPEARTARARVESEDAKASRRRPAKPASPVREPPPPREPVAARETPPQRAAAAHPAPAREAAPPAASTGKPAPVPVKSIDEIRRAAAAGRPSPSPKPAAPPQPKQAAAAPAKPAAPPASSKPAAPARPPAGTRPGQAKPPPAQPASQGQRPSAAPARAARPAETDKEALESSILAAIAQAVDVLVEDSTGTEPPTGEEAAADLATPEPEPEPNPSEGGESDDIGDEIQRIIASYSKARQQGSG